MSEKPQKDRERAVVLARMALWSAPDRAFFKRQARRAGHRRATSQPDAAAAVIEGAIRDRACLSGKHVEFRVRFAPHVLGRDECGRHIVLAFEYGGLTLGRAHWVCFVVDRLRQLNRTEDPWRSGSLESRPQIDLADIAAAVDDRWVGNPQLAGP